MTGKSRGLGSDLKKVDAHRIRVEDYREIPELTGDWFDAATVKRGDVVLSKGKGGRPKAENPKKQITLRLDSEIVDRARATGPGWQSRINAALRKAFGL